MPHHPTSSRTTRTIAPPADWASILTVSSVRPRTPPGDGWQTSAEIAEDEGIPLYLVQRRLKVALDRGVVERFRGTQETPSGNRVQTWWRRLDSRAPLP